MSGCHPERYLYSKKRKVRGLNKIGAGSYGQVSRGCTTKGCTNQIAVKKSRDDMSEEFRITQLAYGVAPRNIPAPYYIFKCRPYGSILYSQFIPSETLYKYRKITKKMLHSILKTIYKLNQNGIRHNDLHLNNILIEDGTSRPYITDFGFGETSHYTRDAKYDYHLFLNMVYAYIKDAKINAFIRKVVPKQYLGKNNVMVKRYRLRNFSSYPGLPSLRKVLSDSYFKSSRSRSRSLGRRVKINVHVQ
jgi:tRNA A-37 threonylcarbamoyl transferase component Bud32